MEPKIPWVVNQERVDTLLAICTELYNVEPSYDENGQVDACLVFRRQDVIDLGISDDGELPERISKKRAKQLARIAIDPDLN